ncbi:hypothetical protein [Sinomonas atrocyanea]|uniref:hypothetical protein n=1 Tax=Sinomonas atrocyanea TaxID=37927 RepID=UPI002860DDE4|nr:hypothetical protein [Sinomonas atrocyanea]MDR6623048.1 hypothetical protein [Sinomonas atrocyanea]
MANDPLAGQPEIIRRSARSNHWGQPAQAAILFEALMCERRNAEHWRLKYEAARASLEARVKAGQETAQ